MAGLQFGQVLGRQVVPARDEGLAGVGSLELAEAGDVRRAQAHEGLGVRVGREERLPGGVVLVGRDLHVERPEDLDAGGLLEGFLHTLRAILEDREAREAVPDDDLAGGAGATELVEDLGPEDSAAFDRALADIWRLDARDKQVELHDRHTGCHDVVQPTGHRHTWNRCCNALDAGGDQALDRLELGVGVAAFRTRDLEVHVEVLRGGIRAVDDLLDEWVANDVGHEPELDPCRVRICGRTSGGRSHARWPNRRGRGGCRRRPAAARSKDEGDGCRQSQPAASIHGLDSSSIPSELCRPGPSRRRTTTARTAGQSSLIGHR